MFEREARLGARMRHPNLVDVLDAGSLGGQPFLAMSYVEGAPLSDLLRRALRVSLYPPQEVLAYALAQVARALGFMHEGMPGMSVVHRDVSPSNVIISHQGEVKLVDYGIAMPLTGADSKDGGAKEDEAVAPGKYSYMAPEQILGEPVDGRADIFSLGVVLYETMLARRLFRGPKAEIMSRVVNGQIEPPTAVRRDFPPELELVIMRALERRPDDRYPSADMLADDLERFCGLGGNQMHLCSTRLAAYMGRLFSPENRSSETGVMRMKAFFGEDGAEMGSVADIQVAGGPGPDEIGPGAWGDDLGFELPGNIWAEAAEDSRANLVNVHNEPGSATAVSGAPNKGPGTVGTDGVVAQGTDHADTAEPAMAGSPAPEGSLPTAPRGASRMGVGLVTGLVIGAVGAAFALWAAGMLPI